MHAYTLVPLFACLAAVIIAAAIFVRDPGQRANRLVVLILLGSAHWSLCDVLWSQVDDPHHARALMQLSSLGWVPLGALTFHLFVEFAGEARWKLRRLLPTAYGTAALGIALYAGTPWGVGVTELEWGWGPTFGPLFPVIYVPIAICINLPLALWPRLFPPDLSRRERREAFSMFAGIAGAMTVASLTDVVLPYFDVHVLRLGSSSALVVGLIVARSVSRYGYFLLAPGAFTREILETLSDSLVLLQPDGRIRTCNSAFARLVGRSPEALRQVPITELLPALPAHPETALRECELELTPQDGDGFPVSVSLTPLREEPGRAVGRVLTIRDLREVEALRGRLVTAGRLAAVGELAAGIAHEIRNPITYVRANLERLRSHWEVMADAAEKAGDAPSLDFAFREGEELIQESLEGVDRVTAVVRDVGAFSHAGLGDSESVDLNALLDNAVNVAALSFSVLVERCYEELPPVRCAPQQLKQVFLNLLLNALHAVGDYGCIRLVTKAQGSDVVVRVEDDGCGIPREEIERIFDPFFTTRQAGEGTGLGLAHCYQIVKNLAGDISATSEPGRGTVFEIRLPAEARAAAS